MARILSIRLRRGPAAQWNAADPVLDPGEAGFVTDTGQIKVGDGATSFTNLTAVTSDLPDVAVTAASATLAANMNSGVTTSGGTFTAPGVAGGVTTPPRRFALTNRSNGPVSLSVPNPVGTTLNLTLLAGEVTTFRQVTVNGYINESGNKPLARLDERYMSGLQVMLVNAAVSPAVMHTWYRADTTSGTFTITLPAAPYDGAVLIVENTGTTNSLSVSRGGSTDTIEGATTLSINPGDYAELTYRVADGIWYRRRSTSSSTGGTDVRRNSAGQISLNPGTSYDNAVVKSQLDSAFKTYRTPRTTNWALPSNLISGVAAQLTAAMSGIVSFVPLEVGPNWPALTALGINTSAAAVAGTISCTLGVYADGGDGAGPNCAGGPIRSGAVSLATTTGNKTVAIASWTPPVGLYWLAFLYVETSAPTTRASAYGINAALNGPIASSASIGATIAKGWQITGQTALPTTDIRSSLTPNTANAFIVGIQSA